MFDVCTDGVCRVDPSTLLDVSALTTVKARAPAYDLTDADHGGCGKNLGCGAGRTRDGKVKETSRWSCSEKLDKGPCFIQYTFDSPQDVVSLRLAFHEGDQSARTMRVSAYRVSMECPWSACPMSGGEGRGAWPLGVEGSEEAVGGVRLEKREMMSEATLAAY